MIITPEEIEIIDAQVHLNQLGPDWQTAPIDSVIALVLRRWTRSASIGC